MFLNKISALAGLCSKQNAIRKIMPHRSIFAPAVSTFVRYYSFDDFDDRPKGYAKHYSQQRNPKRSFDNEDNRPRHFQRNNFQSKNFQRNDYQRGYQQNNNSSFGQMTRPNWKEIELNEIKRNFYQPHETTLNRSDEDVQKYREQHEIAAPRDTPKPILSFDELSSVPGQVLTEMKNRNFESLTPIQAQGWPIALSGQNMVGVAQTGSGKTLGFILPAVVHILGQPTQFDWRKGPLALVLAPTRELAQQIQTVANEFGRSSGIKNACLFGGAAKSIQINNLRGAQLVIGTPGRIIDLMSSGAVSMAQVSYLVLDEADRMLDMGFEPQIRSIIDQIRPDRQTLMFSATWPKEVRDLARDYLGEYTHLRIGSDQLVANPNIKQIIKVCEQRTKDDVFNEVIDSIQQGERNERKTLIFSQTKRKADEIAYGLKRRGINCTSIHSDKSQYQRENILNDFRNGKLEILVATEVAARGLDVDNIQNVINYDYPNSSTEYIHRIGRTGRRGEKGTAYTLVTSDDGGNIPDLIKVLKQANQEVPAALYNFDYKRGSPSNRFGNSFNRRRY